MNLLMKRSQSADIGGDIQAIGRCIAAYVSASFGKKRRIGG